MITRKMNPMDAGMKGLVGAFLLILLAGGCSRRETPMFLEPETERLLAAGEKALSTSDYTAALAYADSVEARSPRLAPTAYLRGLIYAQMLRYGDSDKEYRRALRLDPNFPGAWNNLGNNAIREMKYPEAVKFFNREIEKHPGAIPYRGLGRALVEMTEFKEAEKAFLKAVELDSTYVDAFIDLSHIYERDGDLPRALKYAQQAARLNPANAEAMDWTGNLLVKMNRPREAIPYLTAACKIWPWYHGSFLSLGQAFSRLGDQEQAKLFYKEAENLREINSRVENALKTLNNNPDNPYNHAVYASTLRRQGRYREALHSYRLALFLKPEEPEIMINMGAVYLLLQDTLNAEKAYRTVLDHDPKNVDAWMNLGVVYALAGRVDEALGAWKTAEKLRPGIPELDIYRKKLQNDIASGKVKVTSAH